MKATKLRINNILGIRHLELDGKSIELRGGTGAGKTSVIDAIRTVLTNHCDREYIVRNGEAEGEIFIETDTGLAIHRKKRAEGYDYNKITENGLIVKSPQALINEIFTPLQLNPVEFAHWEVAKQNRAILDLIEFDWDINWIKEQFGEIPAGVNYQQHILQVLDDIQSKNGDYYKRREELNRKELYKRQQITDIAQTIPAGYNLAQWEKYSLAEKIKELQTAQMQNNQIERAKQFIAAYDNKVRGFQAQKDIAVSSERDSMNIERSGLQSTIERLKAEIKAAEDKLLTLDERLQDKIAVIDAQYNENVASLEADIKVAREYESKEIRDVSDLQQEITQAERMKQYISEYKSLLQMKDECVDFKMQSDELTRKIMIARSLPGKVLETAKIPVTGLTVADGKPLINGLPLSNLSDGELIGLCVDIALSNPKNLKIILINGAEALDSESRDTLYAKCKEKGLQIIAARTTDDSEFTIVEL